MFRLVTVHMPAPGADYRKLFRILHETPFAWTVIGDKNRMADALELRDEFVDERKPKALPIGWLDRAPSVLEVLIRFSRRAEFNTEETAEWWFWKFLDNLGLSHFKYVSDEDAREIEDILYRFIWRQYDYNGEGGMFPLHSPRQNQAQVELWYQFHAYIQDAG